MKIFGVDFTSAPSSRKPITYAVCELRGRQLHHIESRRLKSFKEFKAFLRTPGPWVAGFDFPFGQPRKLIDNLQWDPDWESYVSFLSKKEMEDWDQLLREYRSQRPKGDKQHLRETDRRAQSKSPMMMYGVPVGKMFFEGAHRLLESGVSIIPCRPTASDGVALEAYPAQVARHWVGRRSYKADDKNKQTLERRAARQEIVEGLRDEAVKYYGIEVRVRDSLARDMVTDPTGDTLDGLLCAVQAATAYTRRNEGWGVPENVDACEGWIVGEFTGQSLNNGGGRREPMDIEALQGKLRDFAKARDWEQYHTPKNLSMALAVEAAELVEIFQWLTPEESMAVKTSRPQKDSVEDELGDILNYAMRLADVLDIDLERAVLNKMGKNALKYPAKGSMTPKSRREPS